MRAMLVLLFALCAISPAHAASLEIRRITACPDDSVAKHITVVAAGLAAEDTLTDTERASCNTLWLGFYRNSDVATLVSNGDTYKVVKLLVVWRQLSAERPSAGLEMLTYPIEMYAIVKVKKIDET